MRLVFMQFGPYAEAVHRFAAGGPETFYAQRYSVDFVGGLAASADVTVLHLSRDDVEERLPSGIRSLGVELFPRGRKPRRLDLVNTLRRLRPDHLIVASPLPFAIAWALANGIRVLPLFADSFRGRGVKARLTSALLAWLLNNRRIDWVSNHNLAASLELARIGVGPQKVLPFDWPAFMSPAERPPKELPSAPEMKLFYVGQVTELKGVGDILDAIRGLNARAEGPRWRATIAGGHDEALARKAEALGVAARVEFVGRVPHDRVVPLMNQHDVVVVPSRHEYPEGLPMSLYEAFCSRTPLLASDHPMFRLKLTHDQNALVFRAGDPAALAEQLERLGRDPALYARLSRGGEDAAADFFCPLKYHELISRWLSGTAEDREALASYSLASGRYDRLLAGRGMRDDLLTRARPRSRSLVGSF
jgi:glycosyltransferase involved in cell wall biosynthesis